MQAQCTQCSSRIQIDDGKVPDKPFKVKCPKCQAVISLPGKGAAAPAAVAPEPAPAPPAYELPPPPEPGAVARRERAAASQNDALIALAGPAASALHAALANLGFNVDTVDDVEEGARLVEQGVYEVAVTSRAQSEAGKPEPLQQRLMRMAADSRRQLFVILVGDEFRTGDGIQAWIAQADLVVNPNDASRCEHVIRATMSDRKRLYQPLVDARKRIESA